MRILVLNQFYAPDRAATAQLAADLCESLAARGHDVTVVAGNRLYAQDGTQARSLPLRERTRGVSIRRVPTPSLRRLGALRLVDEIAYLGLAALPLHAGAKPDVVLALTTPPLLSLHGLLLRRLRGVPLVVWSMDVYPDLAIRLGLLREGGAAALALAAAARAVLRGADAVVALDEAMAARLVAQGAEAARVHVIDNWCDGAAIVPAPIERSRLRRALGLPPDAFTVSYSGHMGRGHDFETVLAAMALLSREPVEWLFIGDGPKRAHVERAARSIAPGRTRFLAARARHDLPDSLTAAHASLVTVDASVAGLLAPSKLYGLLAAGVPVLYVGPREGRAFSVAAHERAGLFVDNGDAPALAAAIRRLRDDERDRRARGRRARALFDERYAMPIALARHHALLERAAAAPC